jgi:lysophospholipase L1-like esterase
VKDFWAGVGAVLILVALVVVSLFTPRAHAATAPDPIANGVYVIGDSITRQIHNSVLSEALRPDGWKVDGVGGRRVTALNHTYVVPTDDAYIAQHYIFKTDDMSARTLVIALGTNASDEDLTVEQAELMYRTGMRRALWYTGADRTILVTQWRDPSIWYEGGTKAGVPMQPYQMPERMTVNSAAMRDIAATTPDVCLMPWRSYISDHPDQLSDGVHPNDAGREAWRDLLFRTIRRCWA